MSPPETFQLLRQKTHTASESNTTYLAYVILQTLECAGDRKTQFIFMCRITRFSYFLSHHIPPQAAPV